MQKASFVAAMVVAASSAYADDPKFVYGKHDDVKDVKKDVEWNASAEAGAVFTTGNSEITTVTGGFHASRKTKDNKFAIDGNLAYARTGIRALNDLNGNGLVDGPEELVTVETITAETYLAKARYDRFLTPTDSLFIAAIASRDIPAGKENDLGGQLGYSRQIHHTDHSDAQAEIGYDYTHESLVSGKSNSIHSARLFVGFKNKLTEGTDLTISGELLTNLNKESLTTAAAHNNDPDYGSALKDTRFNFHLDVSAKVGKNLAFQTAIDAHFDNRPAPLALPGLMLADGVVIEATKLDTIMKASLIYTFF